MAKRKNNYPLSVKIRKFFKHKTRGKKFHTAIAYIGYLYTKFVSLTSLKTYKNFEYANNIIRSGRPVIIVCWHNRIFFGGLIFKRIMRDTGTEFATITSRHKDGRLIGKVMNLCGVKYLVEGSSQNKKKTEKDKGGLKAAREMINLLKNKKVNFSIAVDGPRGPKEKINSEIISIAKLTNAAIITVAVSCNHFITLKTWDAFKVFLPFSKIRLVIGDEFKIPEDFNKSSAEKLKKKLKKEIDQINHKYDKF